MLNQSNCKMVELLLITMRVAFPFRKNKTKTNEESGKLPIS